jgi:hypothetical protein
MKEGGIYTAVGFPICVGVIGDGPTELEVRLVNLTTNIEFTGLRKYFAPLPIDATKDFLVKLKIAGIV